MWQELLVALIVVCIILILFYNTTPGKALSQKCNVISDKVIGKATNVFGTAVDIMAGDPERLYVETEGDFYNTTARIALKRSLARKHLNAGDYFRIGNIYRYYVKNDDMARKYYILCINRVQKEPDEGNDHMLDRIEDYSIMRDYRPVISDLRFIVLEARLTKRAHAGYASLKSGHAAPRTTEHTTPEPMPRHILPYKTPVKKPVKKPSSKKPSLKPTSKKQRVKKYFKDVQTHNSDPQNVHDSHVTEDIKDTYFKIKKMLPPTNHSNYYYIDEIRARIIDLRNKQKISAAKEANALFVLGKMSTGNQFSKINSSETEALVTVWRRMNMTENKGRQNDLYIALVNGLANCKRGESAVVCTGGRVANVVGSLGHVDVDPTLGVLKTKEEVRNEVFYTAHHAMESAMEYARKDPNMKDMLRDYENDTPGENLQKFEKYLKDSITTRLRKDFTGKIVEKDLDRIIIESHAAV